MVSHTNALVRLYQANINPESTPEEAYGYWMIWAGTMLSVIGILAFLWGSVYPRGVDLYYPLREGGIVLAASGIPILLLGVTFRLPLQPFASVLGSVGLIVCGAAIAWFLVVYPDAWVYFRLEYGPRPVILTYVAGIVVQAMGLTIVPGAVRPSATRSTASTHPYYELSESPDGWGWTLYDQTGDPAAESGQVFPERADARQAIYRMVTETPVAGIELTTRQED
jgi:hypothetical protein